MMKQEKKRLYVLMEQLEEAEFTQAQLSKDKHKQRGSSLLLHAFSWTIALNEDHCSNTL